MTTQSRILLAFVFLISVGNLTATAFTQRGLRFVLQDRPFMTEAAFGMFPMYPRRPAKQSTRWQRNMICSPVSCHLRSRKLLKASGGQINPHVIRQKIPGFHEHHYLQMNAYVVASYRDTQSLVSSFSSVGNPITGDLPPDIGRKAGGPGQGLFHPGGHCLFLVRDSHSHSNETLWAPRTSICLF